MAQFQLYEGNKPYIFVSYARTDRNRVIPFLKALEKAGYRIWYDAAIQPGEPWSEVLATHIKRCGACFAFISAHWVASDYCKMEIQYAHNNGKKPAPFFLEDDVTLSDGMEMFFAPIQSVKLSDYPTPEAFIELLNRTQRFQPCRDLSAAPQAAIVPAFAPVSAADGGMEPLSAAEMSVNSPTVSDTDRKPASADAGTKRARKLPPAQTIYVNGREIFNAGTTRKPLPITKAARLTFETVLNDYLGSVPTPNKIRTVEAFIRANPTFLRFEAVSGAQFAAKEALNLKGFSSPVYLATRNDTPTKQRYVTRLYNFLNAAGQKSNVVWFTTDGNKWTCGENVIFV